MREAILSVIPEAADRVPLASRISTLEDVIALDTAALRLLKAEHNAEIVSLEGRIEVSTKDRWAQSARRALQVLRMHNNWIADELRRRDKAEALRQQKDARRDAAELRAENLRRQQENIRESHQARLERIKASNDATAQAVAVFKEVAREVLGMEMYEHLWELTRQRLAGTELGAARGAQ